MPRRDKNLHREVALVGLMSSQAMTRQKTETSPSVLILIGVFKLLKASLLIAVALGVHHLLRGDIATTLEKWVHAVRIDPHNHYIHAAISSITGLPPRRLEELSVGTFAYGALFFIEGLGLLFRKRWAEYLTVISTTGLLPLELYELVHRPTVAKAILLAGNLLIVVYLVYNLLRTRAAARLHKSATTGTS
jgi:uncharacterized membrane protein (DUF2068 family)